MLSVSKRDIKQSFFIFIFNVFCSISACQEASIWLFTASLRVLFHSNLNNCLLKSERIYGRQVINAQDRLDQVKPALHFTPFITSCLSATSYSMKCLLLAMLIKRFNEFLCITVTIGRIPSNASDTIRGFIRKTLDLT